MAVKHGKNQIFACFTIMNNNRKECFDFDTCLMAIKDLDSKVENAKSRAPLGLLEVRISMTDG